MFFCSLKIFPSENILSDLYRRWGHLLCLLCSFFKLFFVVLFLVLFFFSSKIERKKEKKKKKKKSVRNVEKNFFRSVLWSVAVAAKQVRFYCGAFSPAKESPSSEH